MHLASGCCELTYNSTGLGVPIWHSSGYHTSVSWFHSHLTPVRQSCYCPPSTQVKSRQPNTASRKYRATFNAGALVLSAYLTAKEPP